MSPEKKSFFQGFKEDLKKTVDEIRIRNAFRKGSSSYRLYTGESLALPLFGKMTDEGLLVLGNYDVPFGSVLLSEEDESKVFYVVGIKKSEGINVSILLGQGEEETLYVKEASLLLLDPDVKEVDVIPCGDRYFLRRKKEDQNSPNSASNASNK